uniref:Cell migration inducing hyaluronidase 2 n=1 Tax=Astyanax mexicanus TaxID=7994 RepID=A0A8B9RCD7_ASTMX
MQTHHNMQIRQSIIPPPTLLTSNHLRLPAISGTLLQLSQSAQHSSLSCPTSKPIHHPIHTSAPHNLPLTFFSISFFRSKNCPDQDLTLRNWNPGQNPKKAVVVGSGERLRLASSATLQSLTILSGGSVVFADNKDGSKNITLQTRHVLIDDGGSLHIGGPKCRYRSRATITLVGRSDDASIAEVPVFGRKFVGVRAGGTLELHGVARPSWTFLTRTVPASGLATGGYAFQKNFSRGINLRVLDQDTGTMLTDERFDTHDSLNDSRRLGQQLRSLPPGRIVALAVGDSAVKSLLEETKKTIQELLGSSYVNDLKYRQAWALVAVVGGGNGSCTEDTREHENHDTGGRALAQRDFVTVDGVRFSVTAYSEWRNGFPISGFQVDAVDQVVLNLQDDVSSWRAGERIVVASTDYSMHQAEEFTLLPCPHCTKRQVRIRGAWTKAGDTFSHHIDSVDFNDVKHLPLGEKLGGGCLLVSVRLLIHWLVTMLSVRDTVGYDTLGHCFFLEDGIEQRNTFFHNLGLVTRPGTILPTDRNDTMCTEIRDRVYKGYNPSPATECKAVSTFWIANPNNNLINNAAAGFSLYLLLLTLCFRFRPHEDSDPTKPRVAALIDTLISFKNNDLGAWIRGGDIIIQNSGFADNGVGLSFASDGSYPKDVGSSQEVSESLFVGESKNRGSNGGQNKYWGVGGVDGKMRTLPRNKTFPIRGFQIYDGPVRLLQSTFKSYMPTSDRFTSAVGFNLKNVWQLTPRNNLSSLSFLPSVTLRAFFGRPGQWFEENDLDGDKNSIFHDLDGSVSGYPDTYVARADNFLIRHPECVLMPQWNGCVCSGRYAQVYIKTTGVPNLSLSIIRDEYPDRPMVLRGINSQAAPSQQYQPVLMMSKSYTLHWNGQAPREIVLSLANFDVGDWALLGLCYPPDTVFQVMSDIYNRQTGVFDGIEDYGTVSSLDDLEKRMCNSQCFSFLQVAFSSDPSISFIQTQIKSLSLAEEQKNDTQAFIAVNNQRYDLAKTGFFTVSVDACTGKVNKYSFFPKLDSKMEQHFKSGIPVRSIVLLASRGQPAGIAGVAQYLVPLGAAKVADLQGRASLAFFGFQGSSPLQPWVSLVLSRGEEAVGMQERYIPLSLVEYACPPPSEPPARKDLELLRKALS